MSAESGVPTYRGEGGIWHEYKWEQYACQKAWEQEPEKVFEFHDLRRKEALKCDPHPGHAAVAEIESTHPDVTIVTQNIDGMHQRAGSTTVIELHGSLWRVRCEREGKVFEDLNTTGYERKKCDCGEWLRPDIIWFSDFLNPEVVQKADEVIAQADLFISIGTSGVVFPAAGYPQMAKNSGAEMIEVNPEPSDQSYLFDKVFRQPAGSVLPELFA
jgi:NAD-dependent deacetylase